MSPKFPYNNYDHFAGMIESGVYLIQFIIEALSQ
jgi:hypothetical protein